MNPPHRAVFCSAVLASLLAMMGTGCAPTRIWQNPNLPSWAWKSDEIDCQQVATGTANEQFTLAQEQGPVYGYQPSEAMRTEMDQAGAEVAGESAFERCMHSRGYYLAPSPRSPAS